MKAEIIMGLDDGYTAPKPFYDRIKHEILDVLHVLQPGADYTAKELCGPDLWKGLKGNDASLAGRCVADMVRKGVLPLRFAGCEYDNPKRYTLN